MHVCNARECKQTQTQSVLMTYVCCVVLCCGCGCVELPYYGDIATAEEEQVFVRTSEFLSNYVAHYQVLRICCVRNSHP